MVNHTINKTCSACGAWQLCKEADGECRLLAPALGGWPRTTATAWCRQWVKDERPVPKTAQNDRKWQIGINYAFVRDYPEKAAAWLAAVMANPDSVPAPLPFVLDDLLGGVLTEPLLDCEGVPCCEDLFVWAEKLPGFCNDDTPEGENEYVSLLMSFADSDEHQISLQARNELPSTHPWHSATILPKQLELTQ